MWIAVIAAVVCFSVSVILFTPPLRPFPFYRSISLFFLFEGLWALANAFLVEYFGKYEAMMWIQYLGLIVIACFIFYSMLLYYNKYKKENKSEQESEKSSLEEEKTAKTEKAESEKTDPAVETENNQKAN